MYGPSGQSAALRVESSDAQSQVATFAFSLSVSDYKNLVHCWKISLWRSTCTFMMKCIKTYVQSTFISTKSVPNSLAAISDVASARSGFIVRHGLATHWMLGQLVHGGLLAPPPQSAQVLLRSSSTARVSSPPLSVRFPVFLKPTGGGSGSGFALPASLLTPMIMIGPGIFAL
jgi:hypothetical protein